MCSSQYISAYKSPPCASNKPHVTTPRCAKNKSHARIYSLLFLLFAVVSAIRLSSRREGLRAVVVQSVLVATEVGIWEALSVLVFSLTNALNKVPYDKAETSAQINWHRRTLAWKYRITMGLKPKIGMIFSRELQPVEDKEPWQFKSEGQARYSPSLTTDNPYLTFYVSRETLMKYPHLSTTLVQPTNHTFSEGPGAPFVFYIHGGGFVYLDNFGYEKSNRRMAVESGAVVVAIDYRKPPEHPFPVPVKDCLGSVHWVAKHAKKLGLNPKRLSIAGDSAGGHLAIMTVSSALHRPRTFPWVKNVKSLGLVYPLICMVDEKCDFDSRREHADLFFSRRRAMQFFSKQYLSGDLHEEDWSVHPMKIPQHLISMFPPTYVSLVTHDTLRDEGAMFHARLQYAGVNTTLHMVTGIHGLFASQFSTGGTAALKWMASKLAM